MAFKEFSLPEIGNFSIYKRRGTRSIKISISKTKGIRLTQPFWLPYKAGVEYVKTKKEWILSNSPAEKEFLKNNTRVGKAHVLIFTESTSSTQVSSKLYQNEARVSYPINYSVEAPDVQKAAERIIVKALTREAEELIPKRLQDLAEKHGFSYKSIVIKKLSSRWGSCTHQKDITINCFLMQLPWDLIDYVLLHELVHTRVLAHGKPFWSELEKYIPNLQQVRKTMRSLQPTF